MARRDRTMLLAVLGIHLTIVAVGVALYIAINSTINSRFDAINDRLTSLDDRLTRIETRLSQQIERLDRRLSDLERIHNVAHLHHAPDTDGPYR